MLPGHRFRVDLDSFAGRLLSFKVILMERKKETCLLTFFGQSQKRLHEVTAQIAVEQVLIVNRHIQDTQAVARHCVAAWESETIDSKFG